MNDLYDKKFLELTIAILKDNINDLGMWSVYNEDKYSDEVHSLEKHLKHIEDVVKQNIPF